MQVETPADAAALGRNLSARIGARAAEADARGSLPDEDILDLVAAGYPGLSAPRDLGGRGASLAACVAANLELAKGSPSTALVAAMTVHLVGYQREVRTWPSDIFERLSSAAAEGQHPADDDRAEPRTVGCGGPMQAPHGRRFRLPGTHAGAFNGADGDNATAVFRLYLVAANTRITAMEWSGETIATITLGIAILAFLWNLHRDMAALRERMARLEGTVQVLAKVMVDQRQDMG